MNIRQLIFFFVFLSQFPKSILAEEIDFNRDVRPLLSENCFFCHGPDPNTRQADLRLDQHAGALAAIVPDQSHASELFARISSDDPDLKMPPPDSNRKLTKQQVETLRKWIDSGAKWGEHWSWVPLENPLVPDVAKNDSMMLHNPIDAFIQAKLVDKGILPSVPAERHRLLRRVTLDLTGVPPTSAEYERFLADHSPNAYENVVDQLLASPNFGERMAWDWLDAARYADTNGYQGDNERTMWPWRDWVINAFNSNMPYDQFTVWQLAGDLLPEATHEQKLATGFLRNHPINGEGGRIAEENRVDYVFDMAETTGTVWMGLTFNCCRCHDHKYDALLQKDYYALNAFFNQTPVTGGGGDPQTKPFLAVSTVTQQEQLEQLQQQLATLNGQLSEKQKSLAAQQPDWEAKTLAESASAEVWKPLEVLKLQAEHQTLEEFNEQSIFASGENPNNDTYTVHAKTSQQLLTGIRLDVLKHESHFNGGLARSNSGNFVLTEFEVAILNAGSDQRSPVIIKDAEATYEQGNLKVVTTFDGNPQTGWAVFAGKPVDREHAAVFRFESPVTLADGEQLVITLRHDSQHVNHNIGRFRLSATNAPQPMLTDGNQALLVALKTPVPDRTQAQTELLRITQHTADVELTKLEAELKEVQTRIDSHDKSIAKVMVMEDMDKPRTTYILDRGLYTEQKTEVTAAVPESLPPLPSDVPANRLTLAQWLVSKENPLTARVTVNRFWQQLFGVGLVKTTEDFGVQAEIPIYLDLLNWLANDFVESGWDVKRFMKQVVMSQTYQQTSKVTAALLAIDPQNQYLARGPRYRLPSWMLRDQALAVSGLLVNRQGGPSVNVYQPPGVWEEASFGKKVYKQDHGDDLYRRSLYIFWRRIASPTIFFDTAQRQSCEVKPYLTNTPLHALQILNDVTYVEASRMLAQLALQNENSDEQRLNFVFQRVLGRPVLPQEQSLLLAGLKRTQAHYKTNAEAVQAVLSSGESPRNMSLDSIDHASWTALCLAVLNLDETLSKE